MRILAFSMIARLNRYHFVGESKINYRRNNRNQNSRFALWSQGELIGIYSRLRDIKRAINYALSFNGFWVEDTDTGKLLTHRKASWIAAAA